MEKIILNGKNITNKVDSIKFLHLETIWKRMHLNFTNDIYEIVYKNWRVLKTWNNDVVEITEKIKPKFKVWDYVVWEKPENKKITEYIKIFNISNKNDNDNDSDCDCKTKYVYNIVWEGIWNCVRNYYYCECKLREPIEKELLEFFR